MGLHQLFIHTLGNNFYTLVVKAHAIVDGPVLFQESDTRAVGVPLPKMAGGGAYGNASETHVGVILDAKCRLVGTGGQDDGATEIKGIAVVRKSNDPLESLAKVGAATHKRDDWREPGHMPKGVVPELRGLAENPTNQGQDLVTELQIIFVIRTLKSHIS